MEKQSFQSWERNFTLSFLICEMKVTVSSIGDLTPKQDSWRKKSILMKRPPLGYYTDGLRVFVDITEYPSKETFAQLKSRQQLYVALLKNSTYSLYESAKEKL